MKLRNILITAAAIGFMFASANRTGVVGYTAGDYSDMNTFAHKVAGQNVAWTTGDDFTAVWSDGGTTWGFVGGNNSDLVDMWWSNGTYGLNVGLNMPPEDDGDTSFGIGFGMELMGMDVGLNMSTAEDSDMSLNVRRACSFWAFDTFTFAYDAHGATGGYSAYTDLNFGMYSVNDWGPATGMFGLSFTSSDDVQAWSDMGTVDDADDAIVAINDDGYTAINTSFSVESTLTNWCDLRIGYTTSFNMADNSTSDNYKAGLGFNYGSVQLDMTITDALDTMVSNPMSYATGRNADGLTTEWTLTYSW